MVLNKHLEKKDYRKLVREGRIFEYLSSGAIFFNALTYNNILVYFLVCTLVISSWKFMDNCFFASKDYEEIDKLKQIFLQNYNELINYFNFSSPLEIFTLYDYMLKNGFLSKDREFIYNDKSFNDIAGFYYPEVFNGEAVCRHIADLLNEILNNYGLKSSILGVNASSKYTMMPKIVRSIISNHAINYVELDGLDYFLDATNDAVYKRIGKRELLTQKKNLLIIKRNAIKGSLANENPTMSFKEANLIISSATNLCKNQTKIFKEFYMDNYPLYEEITKGLILTKEKRDHLLWNK